MVNEDPIVREGLGFADYRDCCSTIQWILENPNERLKGRLLLYAFQWTRHFLEGIDPLEALSLHHDISIQSASKSFGMEIVTLGLENSPQIKRFFSRLWSSPGFANYFLSGEIFLSKHMKELKMNNLVDELPPQEELLANGTIDPRTKRDLSIHIPFPFIELMFSIFQLTVVYSSYNSETNLSKLALNAVRVSMKAWTCPFVRASIPTQLFNVKKSGQGPFCRCDMLLSLLVMSKFFFKKTLDAPDELLPGLTAKDFLSFLITEETLYHMVNKRKLRYIFTFLDIENDSNEKGEGAWEFLSISDRLLLFNEVQKMSQPGHQLDDFNCASVGGCLIRAVTVGSTKYVLGMYDRMVEVLKQPQPSISRQTANRLGSLKNTIIKHTFPSIATYLEVLEPMYRHQMFEEFGEDAHDFPDDVVLVIAEYASCLTWDSTKTRWF